MRGAAMNLGDAHPDLVDEAPRPVLARLERADDRVTGRAGVRARVAVGRVVAAADVAALQADAQVQPEAAGREAVLAAGDGLRAAGDVNVSRWVQLACAFLRQVCVRGSRTWNVVPAGLGVERERAVVAVDDDAARGREPEARAAARRPWS